MDATESRDMYEIFTERHRAGSRGVTSNPGPDEWITTFTDLVRTQSAIEGFVGNRYDLVIDGQSYRSRQKPRLTAAAHTEPPEVTVTPSRRRSRRRSERLGAR